MCANAPSPVLPGARVAEILMVYGAFTSKRMAPAHSALSGSIQQSKPIEPGAITCGLQAGACAD